MFVLATMAPKDLDSDQYSVLLPYYTVIWQVKGFSDAICVTSLFRGPDRKHGQI
jgi:hypothetical protein